MLGAHLAIVAEDWLVDVGEHGIEQGGVCGADAIEGEARLGLGGGLLFQ